MPSRGQPVHVVTTTRRYKDRTYATHLLRRSFRRDGKVCKETVGNLSHLPDSLVDLIRRALRGETVLPATQSLKILRSRPHGHVAAVLGTLRRLGLDRLLASRPCRQRDLCLALVAARILAPDSKLATARRLDTRSATATLGDCLGLGPVSADDLYDALDWLLPRQARIEQALAKRHLAGTTLLLYDVSSSYLTGRHCPLGRIGYSRDGKRGTLQIVYGLLCNAAGCPLAVQVYDGNTADPTTVRDVIAKARRRFGLERVVLVGDRGMLTSARIEQELRPVEGLDWISALRNDAVRQLAADDGPLQLSLFDHQDLAEITHPDFPGERLLACLNPLLQAERRRKREELLQATERELGKVAAATGRDKQPLRGKDQIGLRTGRVLNRFKVAKHFDIEITDQALRYQRREAAIAAEQRLDGVYVVRTSVGAERLGAAQAVLAYKSLARVERAFRCLKTVDLQIRPIYHRLGPRVRAHVFLCVLAYYAEWHMRRGWAPLLYGEDDPAGAQAARSSPVQPARKSPRARAKAARGQTPDGHVVHDFRGLLENLATLTRNTVQVAGELATFEQLSVPTALQRKAFELLQVEIKT